MAIHIPCRLLGDELVGQIARDALGRARLGRADTAAARREHDQAIARRHLLESLAAHFEPGFQADVTGRAVAPTIAPARRMIDAVECRQNIPRPPDAAADLDDLPMPALRAPGAAGIRPQLLLPEDQRRLALGDLDRRAAHAARIGGGRTPLLVAPGAA